ncbi:hypothetical protein [Amycolatopsis sp. lyj-23]|uniref:hypothetical protein n=1 Tax=Amycolatopsis sp. lyj-23 TaxID=2789283 RepID=UPI00397B42C3
MAATVIVVSLVYYAFENPSLTTITALLSSASFLLAALALITRDDAEKDEKADPNVPTDLVPALKEVALEARKLSAVLQTARPKHRWTVAKGAAIGFGGIAVGCLLSRRRK